MALFNAIVMAFRWWTHKRSLLYAYFEIATFFNFRVHFNLFITKEIELAIIIVHV